MIAIISRASGIEPPCDTAELTTIDGCWRFDERTTDDPNKIPFVKRRYRDGWEWWHADGWDHDLTEDGNIIRKVTASSIVIEAPGIWTNYGEPIYRITIYDDYLE